MSTWQTYLDEHEGQFLDEMLDFLRIPSISALPEHAADVARAGEWVAERMRAAGLRACRCCPPAATLSSMANGCTRPASRRC